MTRKYRAKGLEHVEKKSVASLRFAILLLKNSGNIELVMVEKLKQLMKKKNHISTHKRQKKVNYLIDQKQ